MIFSNFNKIASNYERSILLRLADAGINSVLPKNFINKYVKVSKGSIIIKNKKFRIKNKRIFVIGAGKMANEMALEIEKIIGCRNIVYGIVSSNYIRKKPKKIIAHKATHPIPSISSFRGAKKIMEIKDKFKLNKKDLIISLISGGGSSLLCCPKDGISLEEKRNVIKLLIKCGASVHEITIIKKKISKIKGGKLAEYFYPTPIISLVVSDVIGDDLDVIASGPLTRDKSNSEDALNIMKKYNLLNKMPKNIIRIIKNGQNNRNQKFNHVHQFLLASNSIALEAIKKKAERMGIKVIIKRGVQGEARLVAKKLCEIKKSTNSALFVYGGETTVTLGNKFGKGGRNQEFIAAALKYFNCAKFNDFDFAIASIASDGVDFIKESCGGIIDKSSFNLAKKLGIDLNKHLKNHDTYSILSKMNSSLSTNGLTGTNVGDMMLFLFLKRQNVRNLRI